MLGESESGIVQKGAAAQRVIAPAGPFRLSLLGPFSLTGPGGEADRDGEQQEPGAARDAGTGSRPQHEPGRARRRSLGRAQRGAGTEQPAAGAGGAAEGTQGPGWRISSPGRYGTVALHPDRIASTPISSSRNAELATHESLERAIGLWRGPFLADVTAARDPSSNSG